MYKHYSDFNKSTWFLFPLITEESSKCTRFTYLIDKYLLNTYIDPVDKKLFIVYKNVPEVVDIETLLTTPYLKDVKHYVTHTVYIYQLLPPEEPEIVNEETYIKYKNELSKYKEDIDIFNLFIDGKYSRFNDEYKLKVAKFFSLGVNEYICRIFRKDEKLYHSVYKHLGCFAKTCTCKVNTYMQDKVIEGKSVKREVCAERQDYSSCYYFKRFEMPSRWEEDFELEEKPDLNKETYYELENI